MPKVKLEFNLPDEASEHKAAMNGAKYASIIYDWTNYLREKVKYGDGKDVSWDIVKDEWWNVLKDENVDPYNEE